MSKFKVAICQMNVEKDKKRNLERAKSMIMEAVKKYSPQIVVLPEMFNCPYENKYFPLYAEDFSGETTEMLSTLAKDLEIYIVGGSIPEKDGDAIYNTAYTFNPEGKMIGSHRKMHLFDIDIEGGVSFKESDTLGYGKDITVIETAYCKIGIAICYDMRFPELMRLMALEGAELIILPAAFNMTTGPAHWHELIKIRALDNQVYFVAASPARNLEASYHAYGHSKIVNPWGDTVTEAGHQEEIIWGEIDLDYVKKIREQLPLLKHRRSDQYELRRLKL